MLVAAAAVFMVLSRQDLIRLVRRLEKIGPVGFTAADAEGAVTGLENDETNEEDGTRPFKETKLGLRLELEMKMSSLAKRVFGRPETNWAIPAMVGYANVGSLASADFITRDQAKLAVAILSWTDPEPLPREQVKLNQDVKTFVDKFRITVFAKVVEDAVKQFNGFGASRVGRAGQRDLEVYRAGAPHLLRLIPAFSLVENDEGKVIERIRTRLHRDGHDLHRCVIMVPNGSAAVEPPGGPRVLQFHELDEEKLGELVGLEAEEEQG